MRFSAALTGLLWIAGGLACQPHPDVTAAPRLGTVLVASGLDRPLFLTAPPGDAARLFILEQFTGRIRIVENGTLLGPAFLIQPDLSTSEEQGLLGLAFHPRYATNGFFYLDYTRSDGATVIRRYRVSSSDPDRADPASGTTLLTIPQPQANHNGGWIAFGPDGDLYIGMGDGGNFGDQGAGHDPVTGNAQSDRTRLGKILRLDVDHGAPYAAPAGNPWHSSPSPADEFWDKGLRNPWRCSFDRATGDLYIGDVGQDKWEEIDFEPARSGGKNYGWHELEGFARYHCPDPCDSSAFTPPVWMYGHGGGRCAIVGGYVYRGARIPGLQGAYFFADYCSGQIWTLRISGGKATQVEERTGELAAPARGGRIRNPSSFGEDARGELYICDQGSSGNGAVYRIVSAAEAAGAGAPHKRLLGRAGGGHRSRPIRR